MSQLYPLYLLVDIRSSILRIPRLTCFTRCESLEQGRHFGITGIRYFADRRAAVCPQNGILHIGNIGAVHVHGNGVRGSPFCRTSLPISSALKF